MRAIYYCSRVRETFRTAGVTGVWRLLCAAAGVWRERMVSGRWRAGAVREELRRLPAGLSAEELFDRVSTLGGGLFAPQQDRAEFMALVRTVFDGAPVRAVLEIGTYRGGTLFCWCRLAAPDAVVISLDLPGGFFGGGWPRWKRPVFEAFARPSQQLHLLRCDSHAPRSRQLVERLLAGRRLDLLLIDGDHTLAGVARDFEWYAALVRPGGWVAFHDIVNVPPPDPSTSYRRVEVPQFWNAVKARYEHWEFVQSGRMGIGLLRMPAGAEGLTAAPAVLGVCRA